MRIASGEAIAWHLLDTLRPPKDMPAHRARRSTMITAPAIRAAFAESPEPHMHLVESQETLPHPRSVSTGYDVSKVAWSQGEPGSSGCAGSRASPPASSSNESARSWLSSPPTGWDIKGTRRRPPTRSRSRPSPSPSTAPASPPATTSAEFPAHRCSIARSSPSPEARGLGHRTRCRRVLRVAIGGVRALTGVVPSPRSSPPRRSRWPACPQGVGQAGHVDGPVARSAGRHHLYAHRLHQPLGCGHRCSTGQATERFGAELDPGIAPHLRQAGRPTPRRPMRRSGPPVIRFRSPEVGPQRGPARRGPPL